MTAPSTALTWAQQRFDTFATPDPRRRTRLVQMAAAALDHPAGRVTRVFPQAAAQQGAYDWLEHPAADARALARCEALATARACRGDDFAWVAVDMTDLHITDHDAAKDTGRLGTRRKPCRGFFVTTAFVLRADDSVAGVIAQTYWARPEGPPAERYGRPTEDKETRFWGLVGALTVVRLEAEAPGCRPWLLCDRGADFAEFILDNLSAARLWTVRAKTDRRVIDPEHHRLRALVAAHPVLGWAAVADEDSEREPRRRVARVALRATRVTLELRTRVDRRQWSTPVWAVSVQEENAPAGVEALSWLLLTSYPCEDFADAVLVAQGYGRRSRIEEYHRVWKSGGCDVEAQQLRDAPTIEKWSRLLSSVAVRLIQLRDASRQQPAVSAAEWFTPVEIEATVLLRAPRDHTPGVPPTLGRMVRWVAELGGYTGKSSGGPPGIIVLTRGLQRIELLAVHLRRTAEHP